ncbi:MAG: RNA polymerase sigma factor [Bacteroidota bacterium]
MLTEDDKKTRFWALYDPLHEPFVRYCRARAYGEYSPQDLVHESLLRAYEGFERVQKPEAFLYFLFGIARRVLQQQSRRFKFKGTYQESQAQSMQDETPSQDQQVDVQILYAALKRLPTKQREALILYEICGFAVKEIQVIQQAGASAVKARLARGRKQLAQLLKDPTSRSVSSFSTSQSISS